MRCNSSKSLIYKKNCFTRRARGCSDSGGVFEIRTDGLDSFEPSSVPIWPTAWRSSMGRKFRHRTRVK